MPLLAAWPLLQARFAARPPSFSPSGQAHGRQQQLVSYLTAHEGPKAPYNKLRRRGIGWWVLDWRWVL